MSDARSAPAPTGVVAALGALRDGDRAREAAVLAAGDAGDLAAALARHLGRASADAVYDDGTAFAAFIGNGTNPELYRRTIAGSPPSTPGGRPARSSTSDAATAASPPPSSAGPSRTSIWSIPRRTSSPGRARRSPAGRHGSPPTAPTSHGSWPASPRAPAGTWPSRPSPSTRSRRPTAPTSCGASPGGPAPSRSPSSTSPPSTATRGPPTSPSGTRAAWTSTATTPRWSTAS